MNSSCDKRERRLRRRREKERAQRASETAAQREERLRKRRLRDKARRAGEANEQRKARLSRQHAYRNERLALENANERELNVCLAHDACVMLTSNLWVDMGLVNGAVGTVVAISYKDGSAPPNLLVAVTVKFDSYSGPTFADGTVPITPLC